MKFIKKITSIILFAFFIIPIYVNAEEYVDKYNVNINYKDENNIVVRKIIEQVGIQNLTEKIDIISKNESLNLDSEIEMTKLSSNLGYSEIKSGTENNIKFLNLQNNSRITLNYNLYINPKRNTNTIFYPIVDSLSEEINNLNFTIKLKEDMPQNIKFYLNDNEIPSENITYNIKDNVITGKYNLKLDANDSLAFTLEEKDASNITFLTKISIAVPLIGTFICYLLWICFGKDNFSNVKKTSRLPRTIDVLETSLIYNNEVFKEDIPLLIFELANQGYIKIIEKSNSLNLIKLKDYNGRNYIEALFFKSIFKKPQTGSLSNYINYMEENSKKAKAEYLNEVDIKKVNISKVIEELKERANDKDLVDKYFEKNTKTKKIYISLMTAITLILVTCNPFIETGEFNLICISAIFSIISLVFITKIVDKINLEKINLSQVIIFFGVIICIWLVILIPAININKIYIIAYIIGVICTILMLILYKYMPKRTMTGTKVLGQIEGFQLFLEESTEEELKRVLEVDNQYFYYVLPYTYVFKNTTKMKDKFKKIITEKPIWYESSKEFNLVRFCNAMNKLVEYLNSENN